MFRLHKLGSFQVCHQQSGRLTDTVTSYITFCDDSIIPTRTRVSYNNDKPWFAVKLRQLKSEKEAAFRSGDKDKYKEAKNRFSKEAKLNQTMDRGRNSMCVKDNGTYPIPPSHPQQPLICSSLSSSPGSPTQLHPSVVSTPLPHTLLSM